MITLWLLVYLIEPQNIGDNPDFRTLGVYTTREECREVRVEKKIPGLKCIGVNRLITQTKSPEFHMKTWF